MQDERTDDAPEEQAQSEADEPTPDEERDLVALLDAERPVQRFYLPGPGGKPSDLYYVAARRWTYAAEQRYYQTGMDLSMAMPQGRRRVPDRADVRMDRLTQTRTLLEESVMDFHLKVNGKEQKFNGRDPVWPVFRDLPPEVTAWVVARLREFQGIEVTGEADQGEV